MDIAKIRKKLKKGSPSTVGGTQWERQFPPVQPPTVTSPLSTESEAKEDLSPDPSGEVTVKTVPPPEAPFSQEAYKTEEIIDLLVFKLGGEEYSFILGDVKEILKRQFITPVPLAPFSVMGITSLRGTVIPVIDLSLKLLGISVRSDRKNRILIMEGERGMIGVMVEEVEGVQRCRTDQRRDLPEAMTGEGRAFMDAVFVVEDGRFITLLKKEIIEIKKDATTTLPLK